jgi:UPF0755 protein
LKRNDKVKKIILIAAAGLFLVAAAGAGLMIDTLYRAPDGGEIVRIVVEKGRPFSSLVEELAGNGLIRRPRLIELYAVVNKYDRGIDAGTYEFAPGEKPVTILERLVSGDVLKVTVTVPEGMHLWEVAGAVSAQAGIDSISFVSAVSDPETAARFGIGAPTLEGYLFPETYLVPWGVDRDTMIGVMVNRLREISGELRRARPDSSAMTVNELLTLASIIEAEARLPKERALVSAVYHNRIERGMKLEADPTVAYAMGGYRGRLLYKDLLIDSPYNTYRYAGLPPGPVCNPGRAAIDAALNPDPDCRALYFVASGDGGHIFSLTLKEHLRAIASVRHQRGKGK